MSHSNAGRHEHGQNFLIDPRVIARVCELVAATDGQIVEIGAGDGALSLPLARLGRPVIALELHPKLALRLESRAPANLTVRMADVLSFRLPRDPFVVAGNLPFHLTTAILRRLLATPAWTDAVLLLQWEVARRRVGVGGASMLTASWWPWFDFVLHQRISRVAFRPMPSVDGGLLTIHRRAMPGVAASDRRPYQSMVHRVFTGRGHGLAQILPPATGLSRRQAMSWLRAEGFSPAALPKDLGASQWSSLWHGLR